LAIVIAALVTTLVTTLVVLLSHRLSRAGALHRNATVVLLNGVHEEAEQA